MEEKKYLLVLVFLTLIGIAFSFGSARIDVSASYDMGRALNGLFPPL
jgi:hypothetical protein